MKVIKRDGHMVDWCPEKIEQAIEKANFEVGEEEKASPVQIRNIIKYIEGLGKKRILVEDIQDIIEVKLMSIGKYELAKRYITYRYTRELVRRSNTTDQSIRELIDGDYEYWNAGNSNKSMKTVTTQRDYLAGITSADITRRFLLPEDIVQAHDDGIIHFHDADSFAQNALCNSSYMNLDDMLQNGVSIHGVMMEKPNRFVTAVAMTVQFLSAAYSSQYGGLTISLADLAPFVRESRKYYEKKYQKYSLTDAQVKQMMEEDLHQEIVEGIQLFQTQIHSMTTMDGEVPFINVFLYLGETQEYKEELAVLIEEILKQRIQGMKRDNGEFMSPTFPRLLYVLEEENMNPSGKYYELTKLAAECSSKRQAPDYISEKVMKEFFQEEEKAGDCFPCMGCLSFLSEDRSKHVGNIAKAGNFVPGKGKYKGRFNQGVVTLNLVDIALSSEKDKNEFWRIMDERLELCHRTLQVRIKRLSKVTSDVAPILWQSGALARLEKGESIRELLRHGYSTISLGYAGLYECVKYMTGSNQADHGEGHAFALEVLDKLNDTCRKWREEEDIDYVVYGTPVESTMAKFARCLKDRFGVIQGITDRDMITNSYYLPSSYKIDQKDRLKLESVFQRRSLGGGVSVVDGSELKDNPSAILNVLSFLYENTMYAKINTNGTGSRVCGYTGDVLMDSDME